VIEAGNATAITPQSCTTTTPTLTKHKVEDVAANNGCHGHIAVVLAEMG
jgi:hypothetical protein